MADKWAQRGRKPKGSMSAWGKPQKTRMHLAPPGLKGKAIGMYFKNQAKLKGEEYKKNRELVVTFKIPPTVQAQVNKNLESIAKISGKPRIKIQVPEKKVESEPKCNPENTQVKSEPEPMSEHDFSSDVEIDVFKKPEIPKEKVIKEEKIDDEPKPSTSSSFLSLSDFIPVRKEDPSQFGSGERLLALRGSVEYKYSYEDIITGTFDEKLNESLSNGININLQSSEVLKLHDKLYDDYLDMLDKPMYKKMFKFRELLPTYKKSKDLLDTINNNQVVVISGETGCGKSTQVPQLILDEAILNKKAGNIKILVTQPRRIAASSLALRVAEERGEKPGNSVGYAVRLEKIEARSRGSIMFFTTGVLLSTLEVDQGLTDYSHIILDEVHERDCNIDLSMCMLKKVMQKRKDLKLILMSATIDSEKLSEYFDNCPMLHIEGLAFPVKDIYLEEVLEMTQFQLPPVQEKKQPKWGRHKNTRANEMEKDIKYKAEIAPWLESVKSSLSRETYTTLQDSRIENINVDLICQLILKICQGPPGALLVFLPGINEITKLITFMNKAGSFHKSQYEIYPLHSKLPSLEQHKIFERPPEGVRKIIIATNIAETSITIDDVVYVIDCARLKLKGLDVEEHVSTLQIEWISEANLRQRRGRAGRCQPGVCYHLMTTYRASQIAPRLLPELKRSDLLEALLTVKRLRLGKAADAFVEVPSPPDETTVKRAVQHLQRCGALDEKETLTPLGWHLARLPVHPSAGKLLLLGALFGCLDRAASVAAVWGFKDPFQLVIGKEHEVDQMKRQLALGEPSDQIAISEAVIQWEKCPPHARYNFAYEYFLSHKTLELLSEMKAQLGESLKNMGFLGDNDVKSPWENRNSDNLSLFKALVAAALYPNVYSARWTHLNSRKRVPALAVNTTNMNERNKVFIHPSSVMAARDSNTPLCNKAGANWLVYWLKQKSSDLFLLEVTLVYSLPLLFFGELQVTVKPVDDEDDPTVDNYFLHISNIKVKMPREAAHSIFELRSLLDEVLASKVMGSAVHAVRHSQFEEAVLNAVIQLITAEDERNEDQQDDTSESDHSESDSSQMSYQGRPDYDRPRNRPHFDGRPGRSHYEERQGRPHFQGRHGGPPRGRPYGHGYNSHANWQPNVNHDYTNYYPN